MSTPLSAEQRLLLERAVLAPGSLRVNEAAEVERLLASHDAARSVYQELEAFYGAVRQSYEEAPAPTADTQQLVDRIVRPIDPRSYVLRRHQGVEHAPPYVLSASGTVPARFRPVATLIGNGDSVVARLVRDAAAEECVVYLVAPPIHRAYALVRSDVLGVTVITDGRGRATFDCRTIPPADELDRHVEVHPALCAEPISAAEFESRRALRIQASDGGPEALVIRSGEGVIWAEPSEGSASFRWLSFATEGAAPALVDLRPGETAIPWSGEPAVVRGYA